MLRVLLAVFLMVPMHANSQNSSKSSQGAASAQELPTASSEVKPPAAKEIHTKKIVNGKTLMTLRKEKGAPLPIAEAISYIVEILPSFGYLDEMGLVYCDFKPENAMVEEETVKLIDMGAVRQTDDVGGDIYGSKGYVAPEAHDKPSPLSDLYGVARALAVLVASFDFQGKYETSLPPPDRWRTAS